MQGESRILQRWKLALQQKIFRRPEHFSVLHRLVLLYLFSVVKSHIPGVYVEKEKKSMALGENV